ncbi:MAG TPA: hypothetical protein VNP72_03905 [Longimicrobium sp.]|nr:hypothetical protein [Longimicrobium sp.]
MSTYEERRQRLRTVFVFLVVFGAIILPFIRPDPTPAQGWFRFALTAAGAVGLITLWLTGARGEE